MHSYDLFRPAVETEIPRIWEIIEQAKAQMLRENRRQWDENYPTPAHIADDLRNGYGYVLCMAQSVVAYGAVVFDGEPSYRTIDGRWLNTQPYVVVHRLAVADEMKQQGVATRFIEQVERLSIGRKVRNFRIDTNFDNIGMQRILEKRGFVYCGEITYKQGSRRAYQKLL